MEQAWEDSRAVGCKAYPETGSGLAALSAYEFQHRVYCFFSFCLTTINKIHAFRPKVKLYFCVTYVSSEKLFKSFFSKKLFYFNIHEFKFYPRMSKSFDFLQDFFLQFSQKH